MALTKCRECKESVSSDAKTCPHCGTSLPGIGTAYPWLMAGGTLYFLGCFFFVGFLVVLALAGGC